MCQFPTQAVLGVHSLYISPFSFQFFYCIYKSLLVLLFSIYCKSLLSVLYVINSFSCLVLCTEHVSQVLILYLILPCHVMRR